MDYEFELTMDECIVIDGVTTVQVTEIFWEVKAKLGMVGPHDVWREEITIKNNSAQNS